MGARTAARRSLGVRPPTTGRHTPARIVPAQRAAHKPTGTLHRHAACSPASHLPPPPAPFSMSASRESVSRTPTRTMRHSPRLRASCPNSQAQCASSYEPRSSFACPRLSTSPIQPCPSPLAYVAPRRSIEPSGVPPGAAAGATQRPRCARPGRHRCKRSSHGARRVGLPFGPAPATSAVLPQGRSPGGRGFRAPACVLGAPREVAASPPRFARTAPRPASANAFASLTPPREPPAPFAFPSRAAALRFCRRPATPAALPLPVAHRAPPAWNGSRCSRQ